MNASKQVILRGGGHMVRREFVLLALLGVTSMLSGCGGGGGGHTGGGTVTPPAGSSYPSSVSTLTVNWYPGVSNGGGFSLGRVTAGQTVSGKGSEDRLETFTPTTLTVVNEGAASNLDVNGSTYDYGLEGRYLGFSGSVNASHKDFSSIAKSDYSFTVIYDQNWGKYSFAIPNATLKDLKTAYAADQAKFTQTYGDYYVSGADKHNYVRATYYIETVDSQYASSSGLSINAGGEWTAFGFQAKSDNKSLLEKLASYYTIKVLIETNAGSTDLTRTISNPADVTAVQNDIAGLVKSAERSSPSAYQYYITPWADILANSGNATADPTQAIFKKVATDYFKGASLQSSLQSVTTDSTKYSYLGSNALTYYGQRLGVVSAETSRLLSLLKAMTADPNAGNGYVTQDISSQFIIPVSITFDPYLQNHHLMRIEAHVKGANGSMRARIAKAGQVYNSDVSLSQVEGSGDRPSEDRYYIRFEQDFPSLSPIWNEALNRVDGSGWNLELLNESDQVVAIVPLPGQ